MGQLVTYKDLPLSLSKTQYAFVLSEARYVWMIGAERSGKTYAAICALFAHQQRVKKYLPNNRPMRGCLIRDAHTNIERITVKTIKLDFPGLFTFHDDYHLMRGPGMEIDLMGMDSLDSLSRIQGGAYEIIWMEEPAPILHTGNAGIRHEVFLYTARRIIGGETPKRFQITMNPADEDHWTYKEAVTNPLTNTETLWIKSDENPTLKAEDLKARAETFRDRPDLAKRYDEGKFSKVYAGVKITPEYNEDVHLAKAPLDPVAGGQFFRFYDGGLHASCVIAELTPSGRLFFLDSISMPAGSGMRQLIEQRLIPLLNTPRYKCTKDRRLWRDIGDASLDNREQSDSEYRGTRIINEMLGTSFELGVQHWNPRRESLHDILLRMVGNGLPFVQVNPRITEGERVNWVHQALSGGYSYPVTPTGEVSKDGPDKKSPLSHVGDAMSHGVARLFWREPADFNRYDPLKQIRRAKGYASR